MNAPVCISDNADRQAALTDHLRTTRATIVQAKLTIALLKRHSSAQTQRILDQLCIDMDAARLTLERLDFSLPAGSAS